MPKIFRCFETQLIKEVKADVSDALFQKRLALLADTFCHLNNQLKQMWKQRNKIARLMALAKLKIRKKTETGLVRTVFQI